MKSTSLIQTKLYFRMALLILLWSAFFWVAGVAYYVNHYLPHGQRYATGDFVCQNDDRGPCGEQSIEGLTDVDIPNWAQFFRNGPWVLVLLGLGATGVMVSTKYKQG
jgi:hypothetical protein